MDGLPAPVDADAPAGSAYWVRLIRIPRTRSDWVLGGVGVAVERRLRRARRSLAEVDAHLATLTAQEFAARYDLLVG
ncbi:hypothetical protein [Nocardioides conyzicola]|uniref:Uncharacterized protein n=1 Tax=Nocardioides conyzicola TaxID=1651781 RepID=A0ABP8Y4M2_9ACTN